MAANRDRWMCDMLDQIVSEFPEHTPRPRGAPKALDGISVVDFSHFIAGPLATMMLADMGADVIKIEAPGRGDDLRRYPPVHADLKYGAPFLWTNRNKRSVALDLKSDEGRRVARRLIAGADVVMENFRPGTMERLGLGAKELMAEFPRLIWGAASGYGSDGPYRDRPGQDLLIQAASGLAAATGRADGPPVAVGSVVIDHHAAALYAMGIVAALFARERTGKGRLVEISLLQAAIDLQGESITAWVNGAHHDAPRGPAGIASWFSPGSYGIHATSDGYVALSLSPLTALAAALELPALGEFSPDESFSRREEINMLVADAMRTRPTAEWQSRFEASKVWYSVVEDYDSLLANPQLRHLGAFETLEGAGGEMVTLLKHPVRYDGKIPEVRLVPQELGAQTREVLAEAGFDAAEIAGLEARNIVRAQAGTETEEQS
jgi:crotonobetainyl-CoA:carnitine CoA-transferase CaiB-like acyl-CoA transferase